MSQSTPVILGRGMSGQALAKSFAVLAISHPEFKLAPAVFWDRGRPLNEAAKTYPNLILAIANPHGLHAATLLEAHAAGIKNIIVEKPVCVNPEEARALRQLDGETEGNIAVLHGYRMLWGPQTLRQLESEIGEIFSVEGRYWQSSAASGFLKGGDHYRGTWKGDPKLGGKYGVLLDLATHWIDLACYASGENPTELQIWKSSVLSDVDYLDTHVQITGSLGHKVRVLGSISKATHGATNEVEITLLGKKGSASWKFLNPDEIVVGHGGDRSVVTRKDKQLGFKQPAFHGAGWIEGFTEVCRQALSQMLLGKESHYPRLSESLNILDAIFNSDLK